MPDIRIVLISLFNYQTHRVVLNETGALKENTHPWIPSHYVAGSKNVSQDWIEPETKTTNSVIGNTQFGTRKYMQWKNEPLYKGELINFLQELSKITNRTYVIVQIIVEWFGTFKLRPDVTADVKYRILYPSSQSSA
jgi:hypothetical protein